EVTGNQSYTNRLGEKVTLMLVEAEAAQDKAKRETAEKEAAEKVAKLNAQSLEANRRQVEERKKAGQQAALTKEDRAAAKLKTVKMLLDDGKTEAAKRRLNELLRDFPGTKVAKEAQELLDSLPQKR